MREIKFRAWDTVNEMWLKITGFETHTSDDDKTASINTGIAGMFHDGDYIGTFQKHGGEQNNVILTQYTGLKDTNGVEIYEGDILYALDNNGEHEEYVGVVEYDSVGRFVTTGFPHVTSGDCFVKGNIYENKELLD